MTALLRSGIAVLATLVTLGGSFVLALGAVADQRAGGIVILAGSFALVAMTMPPALIGVFVSYWSWDHSARRRLRILLVLLLAIQLLGAAGLVILALTTRTLLVGAVVLILIAGAETPASIALGRAARRRELQAPPPSIEGADTTLLVGIRRGWRRVTIGSTIGLAVGVVLLVGLAAALQSTELAVRLLFFVPAAVGIGASIGGLTSTLPLARKMRDLLGGDFSSARRIGLAIRGKQQDLTDDELRRAARYTAVAPAWLNLQLTSQAANLLVSLSVIASISSEPGDLQWLLPAFGLFLLAGTAAVIVLRRIQVRRLRAFAAAHPVAE